MEPSNNFLNSLNLILKKTTSSIQNEDLTKEVTSSETAKETKIQKIPTNPEEKIEIPSNNPSKKEKLPEEEIFKNKSSIDNTNNINDVSTSKDKNENEEKPKDKPIENTESKENNKLPKEEKPNTNSININNNIILNDKKEEDEKVKENDKQNIQKEKEKEKNKDDYIFPIPNNNSKIEESKNQDSSFFLFKKTQNNFGSLNLNIPENLRPKNKELQSHAILNPNQNQFQNHQIYNLSYFNPITFSCSLNTHSVKKYKIKPIEKEEDFLEKIIKIADVSNINEFWEVFQHLKKPNQCPVGSDYHIFKKGIVPMWEDKLNKDGGKLSMLLTWKYANVIWEEVTFNFAKGLLPYYDYINGIVISVRPKFLALSFWIKCGNNPMVEKIKNALSGLLQAPSTNCFDFIPFK